MRIIITIAVIAVCMGLIIWMKRRKKVTIVPVPTKRVSNKDLAHSAFVHGNAHLAEGKFAEAMAAFQQALELDPAHPHAAGRLDEVKRQQSANARDPVNPTS